MRKTRMILINNIGIKRKLWIMNVLGVMIPMLLLFVLFSVQIYQEFKDREAILIEEGMSRVERNLNYLFESVDILTYSYLSDYNLSDTLLRFNDDATYKALSQFNELEDKVAADVYAYSFIQDISIYHDNPYLQFYGRIKPIESTVEEPWYKIFYESYDNQLMRYVANGSGPDLYYIRKLNALDQSSRNYIEVLLNERLVKERLYDEFLDAYEARLYIVDKDDNVILTSDDTITYESGFEKFEELQLFREGKILSSDIKSGKPFDQLQLKMVIDDTMPLSSFGDNLIFVSVTTLLIFIFSALMIQLIAHSISHRLRLLDHAMEKSEGDGLIEVEIAEDIGTDEIGNTVNRYNRMVRSVKMLINQVESGRVKANELLTEKSNAYEELETTNEELAYVNNELSASYEEIKVQDHKIHELIYQDALTGLKNRFAINQRIEQEISRCGPDGKIAVMFLDVDNFKYINDTFGHDVGDEVIKATGMMLKELEDQQIIIGRFGGDEFLVIIKNEPVDIGLIDTIKHIKNIFEQAIIVGHNRFYLTASMGVARYPINGETKDDIIKRADLALYKAKELGKNQYVLYDDAMNQSFENKLAFQRGIKEATKAGDFYLNYQPYVDSKTRKAVGFEALIRWQSEEFGIVSPYELIVNAEEMGIIVEIGEWIIREACQFIKGVNENRENPLTISINISAVQLMNKGFVDKLVGIVDEVDVPHGVVCLEMTETVLLGSMELGASYAQRMKDFGFLVALDDFGTGYSSLSYFKELPVSIVKIDKSFIDDIETDEYNKDLVSVMLKIAHNRGVSVTAEGVETKPQYEYLLEKGCDVIQGYYFAKPQSAEAAKAFVENS